MKMKNLKEMIEIGIQMGMTKFSVEHYGHKGKVYEQTVETIFDFIKGYENCIPMSCYFGTYYSCSIPKRTYSRPELCHISFRLENEEIPID